MEMSTQRRTLMVEFLPEQASLLEDVARLRTGQMDPQTPVDLGAYIKAVLDRDIAACLAEINARRGG
jgi:hypothetical protein